MMWRPTLGYIEGLFSLSLYIPIDYGFEKVILPFLKLHMCSFNECSLIQIKKEIVKIRNEYIFK